MRTDRSTDRSLFNRVEHVLARWPGDLALQRAMRSCPKVEVYLAGGALRDVIGSRSASPRDFDFFVGGTDSDSFLRALANAGRLEYGPFGSPRWYPSAGERPPYADIISIDAFYNGLWHCRDIVDALNQFDFTVNAVALDLRNGSLFDPQNGMRDIHNGIMRAVRFDYPDEPISPACQLSRLSILWMRILHYARALKLQIEPTTMCWLRRNRRFKADMNLFAETFFHPDLSLLLAEANSPE